MESKELSRLSDQFTFSLTASLDVLPPPVAEAEAANGAGVLAHQSVVVPLRRFEWEARVVKPRHELVDGVPDGGKPDRVLGGATTAAPGNEIAKILGMKSFSIR